MVEGSSLENCRTGNGTVGSNPTLTAMYRLVHGTANSENKVPSGTWHRQFKMIEMKCKFYYTYVLLSCKDNKFYIGSTSNLKERFIRHNKGEVVATKGRLPMNLVFYEAYLNKFDSLRRERYFKSSKGKTTLKSMLKEYLEQNNV